MAHYSTPMSPFSVVQSSTQPYRNPLKRFHRSVQGIVLDVVFVDNRDNLALSNFKGVIGEGEQDYQNNLNGAPLFTRDYSYRFECTVLVMISGPRGASYDILYHVPVQQRGGIRDVEIWVPKPSTNYVRNKRDLNPFYLDGDVVIIDFIGGIYPRGAIITGTAPHHLNIYDHPRAVKGSRVYPKRFGDGTRKDGFVRFSRYNGSVFPFVDRTGNVLIDTTESNRRDVINQNTGLRSSTQDVIPWTVAKKLHGDTEEIANPGGGDVEIRVKNSRRLRIEFTDNEVLEKDYDFINPRQFRETGFIQVHQLDSGKRSIEIALSDDVEINVMKFGDGEGKLTINTEKEIDGITLGKDDLDRLVTKEFLTEVFLKHVHEVELLPHTHSTTDGPTGPPLYLEESGLVISSGTPGFNVSGVPVPFVSDPYDEDTGQLTLPLGVVPPVVKATTKKMRAE